MNTYVRRHIRELIPCACGCGKLINRYDKRGRERKYHVDCFSPGKKLNLGVKKNLSRMAKEPWRIKQSMEKIKKIHREIEEGKRKPGHYIDGYLRSRPDGYLMIKMPDHPRAQKSGYVFEHILIAERKLGRHLRNGETIHHLNRKRKDNRSENIIVFESPNKHMKLHSIEDNRRNHLGQFKSWEGKDERI